MGKKIVAPQSLIDIMIAYDEASPLPESFSNDDLEVLARSINASKNK